MKNILTTLTVLLTLSFAYSQTQAYVAGTNVYTFNTVGNAQLTGIPVGTQVQIECYGGGGGGGGVWTANNAYTYTGGGGGGGYAKTNSYSLVGNSLNITVGNGGAKGSGNSTCACGSNGGDGGFSEVYETLSTILCKA